MKVRKNMNCDNRNELKIIEQLEDEWVFSLINDEIIWNIAIKIVDYIKSNDLNAGVRIEINNKTVFQFLSKNSSLDNQNWLRRKINSALHFQRSTLYLWHKLSGDNQLLETKYGLSKSEYTIVPGAIPLKLIGIGVVGAIAVSGLLPEEDHKLALFGIEQFIK